MSTTKLVAEPREKTGSAESRRLRRRGLVPGNLYGHGKGAVSFTTSVDTVEELLKTGSRVVEVELSGNVEKALFKEIQFDALGSEIQHVDFMRIDAQQRVDVQVPVEVRGISPGVTAGGVLENALRQIELNCLAVEVPDSIVVRISALDIGDSIHGRDLELPEGATLLTSEDAMIVSVSEPSTGEEAETDDLPGPVEPEVIGKKSDDESGD